MASKKISRQAKQQPNQTGRQSGDLHAQQLHDEAGGIRDPQSRDKSAHRRQRHEDNNRFKKR